MQLKQQGERIESKMKRRKITIKLKGKSKNTKPKHENRLWDDDDDDASKEGMKQNFSVLQVKNLFWPFFFAPHHHSKKTTNEMKRKKTRTDCIKKCLIL